MIVKMPISLSRVNYIDSARQVLKDESEAIASIMDVLDDSFTKMVDLILKSQGRVIVTGMGKSGHIGRKIAATFSSTGQPAFFVHPAEASHGDMGMITPQDIVFALSNSGETAELSHLVEYTKRLSIPLIALTRRRESTLCAHADCFFVLPDAPEACPINLAPTTSTTMMLAFGDALAITLLKARDFTASDFKVFHPGGTLGGKLHKVSDKMYRVPHLPLLSHHSTMREAILVISEKGFGCVGVMDEHHHLIGIITDGDLRRHIGGDLLNLSVLEVMTKNPTTVCGKTLMTEALALMNHQKITALFVVEEGIPEGIIHIHDFLRAGIV